MRILLLDLDTLRPDHLGCYGYHRNTSPNIDRIAGEGVRFTNYHCSDAPCLPSRAALASGRFGIHSGVVGHGGTCGDMRLEGKTRQFKDKLEHDSLFAFLRQQDMRTVSVSPYAERHSAWWFYAGFNEMYNTGKSGGESAEEITPTVLKWIDQNAKEDNWFLHVNYWDPHTYYRAPAEFGNPFKDEPTPDWLTEDLIKQHTNMVGLHGSRELAMFNNKSPNFPRMPGEVTNLEQAVCCSRLRLRDSIHGRPHRNDLRRAGQAGVMDDLCVIITRTTGKTSGTSALRRARYRDRMTTRLPMIVRGREASPAGLTTVCTTTSICRPRWLAVRQRADATLGRRELCEVAHAGHGLRTGLPGRQPVRAHMSAWRAVRPWMLCAPTRFFHLFRTRCCSTSRMTRTSRTTSPTSGATSALDAVYKLSSGTTT